MTRCEVVVIVVLSLTISAIAQSQPEHPDDEQQINQSPTSSFTPLTPKPPSNAGPTAGVPSPQPPTATVPPPPEVNTAGGNPSSSAVQAKQRTCGQGSAATSTTSTSTSTPAPSQGGTVAPSTTEGASSGTKVTTRTELKPKHRVPLVASQNALNETRANATQHQQSNPKGPEGNQGDVTAPSSGPSKFYNAKRKLRKTERRTGTRSGWQHWLGAARQPDNPFTTYQGLVWQPGDDGVPVGVGNMAWWGPGYVQPRAGDDPPAYPTRAFGTVYDGPQRNPIIPGRQQVVQPQPQEPVGMAAPQKPPPQSPSAAPTQAAEESGGSGESDSGGGEVEKPTPSSAEGDCNVPGGPTNHLGEDTGGSDRYDINGVGKRGCYKADLVNTANELRAAHGVGPVEWDDEMADLAFEWAKKAKDAGACQSQSHRGAELFTEYKAGEGLAHANLAQGFDKDDPKARVSDKVMMGWYGECCDYDYTANKCGDGKVCGHMMTVIWEHTTKLGCAMAMCDDNSDYWVCNWKPMPDVQDGSKGIKPFKTNEYCKNIINAQWQGDFSKCIAANS